MIIPELSKEIILDLKEKEERYVISTCCRNLNKIISQESMVTINKTITFVYDPELRDNVKYIFY